MATSSSTRLRSTFIAVTAFVAVISASSSATAAVAAPDDSGTAFTVDGTVVDMVSFDGTMMTLRQYDALASAVDRAGGALRLVVDASAAERGHLVAFADSDDANAYMIAHGMGSLPSPERNFAVEAKTRQAHLALNDLAATSPAITPLSVCSLPNHNGKIYDGTACGGAVWTVLWDEEIPYLSTYGWNNRMSSAGVGDCIGNMTLYKDNSYGGSSTSLGGGDVYTVLPYGYNNTVSSIKTNVTGVCA